MLKIKPAAPGGGGCDFIHPLQPFPSLPKKSYNSLPLAPGWVLFMLLWVYGALQKEPSEGPWEDMVIKPWQRGCDSPQHPGLTAGLQEALPAPGIIHLRLVTQNGPIWLNSHRIRASFSEETKSPKGLWAANSTDHLS